jgi:Flp pilus assembly protein TadB
MKDFNDIQNLWQDQKASQLPDVNNILADAKKVQRALNRKISVQIIILIAVVVFILILMNVIPFKQATTFIGIGIMAVTIVAFSAIRLYQVIQLKKMDLSQNPQQLLLDLEIYYQFQKTVNTRYTQIYFLLMNSAFALYFIEVLQLVPLLYQVIIVVVYLAWMLFAFLYLGKKHKRKEQAEIQSIIDAIKSVAYHYKS